MSSIATGTLGFMPPEQLFNHQLTLASDLYSLGATLICLVTGTKSTAIGQLIDEENHIRFNHLVPKLSQRWIDWLQKMVEPKLANRYTDASTALQLLKHINVNRFTEVKQSLTNSHCSAVAPKQEPTQTTSDTNQQTIVITTQSPPYSFLVLLLLLTGLATWLTVEAGGLVAIFTGVVAGVVALVAIVAGFETAIATGSMTAFVAVVTAANGFTFMLGALAAIAAGILAGVAIESCIKRGFSTSFAVKTPLLMAVLGASLGCGIHWGLHDPYVISSLLISGLPLAKIMAGTGVRSPIMSKSRHTKHLSN